MEHYYTDLGYQPYPKSALLSTKIWWPYMGYMLVIQCGHHYTDDHIHDLNCMSCLSAMFKDTY